MLFISIIAGIALIAADRAIKGWASSSLKPVGAMDFIKLGDIDIIGFYYTENTGAAFGSFKGSRFFLVFVTAAMIIFLIIYAIRDKRKHPLFIASAVLIVSGGAGNLFDRIFYGYVVDYFELRLFDFAIFNFADICVVIGTILFVIYFFISEKKNGIRDKRS